jgi:hypothetical protein
MSASRLTCPLKAVDDCGGSAPEVQRAVMT